MRKRIAIVLVPMSILLAGACSESGGGTNGGPDAESVSAETYATSVCGAIADWVDEIRGLNEDLQANLDPSSIDALKDAMVTFLDDVIASTDTVIADVEDAGVPDVEDGDAAAQHLLTGLRDSRGVFEDARDRVEAMSTDDPVAFGEDLQTVGTDIQTSMSTIGEDLGQFESPELDEVSKDIPECEAVAASAA
ncbi:MAG: hypothetical protein K0R20_1065 [Actinomycetia bacterium]|jgi:hypothetical protein|nr:hypothetical protein [Actinomycetes bacterium]